MDLYIIFVKIYKMPRCLFGQFMLRLGDSRFFYYYYKKDKISDNKLFKLLEYFDIPEKLPIIENIFENLKHKYKNKYPQFYKSNIGYNRYLYKNFPYSEIYNKLDTSVNIPIFSYERALEYGDNEIEKYIDSTDERVFRILENKYRVYITYSCIKDILNNPTEYLIEMAIKFSSSSFLFMACYSLKNLELSKRFTPCYIALKRCKNKEFFYYYINLLEPTDILRGAFRFSDTELINKYLPLYDGGIIKLKKLEHFIMIEKKIKYPAHLYAGSFEIKEYIK